MVAHCLYRTMFVGAVLARLVQFLLDWCTSCSVGALETSAPLRGALLALASGKAERRQVHPLKVHPLRLLLDIPAYC